MFGIFSRVHAYRFVSAVLVLCCLCAGSFVCALTVTQPLGTLVRTWETSGALPIPVQPPVPDGFSAPTTPIEEVNYICAQWDTNVVVATSPFALNAVATEVILTQPQHFVRLLSPGSSINGPWIMRSEYVRGLTPAQLRDVFALPSEPTRIVNVDLPASPASGKQYALWTGVTGPINDPLHPWGNGGTVQNRVISDFNGTHYFPNYAFVTGTRDHVQPIGAVALSYKPMAGCGNTYRVAAYLDKFVPAAYSDMEKVYTALDYLNWQNAGTKQAEYQRDFRRALCQISPERYGSLSFVLIRDALLFGNALFERHHALGTCLRRDCDRCCSCRERCFDLRIDGLGEFGKQGPSECFCGYGDFDYQTGGASIDFDWYACKNFELGIGIAGLANALAWNGCDDEIGSHGRDGKAHVADMKAGLYFSYMPACFFIDGIVSGGMNWSSSNRSIVFPVIDNAITVARQAHAHQKGHDVEAHLQGGINLGDCRCVRPLARLSYFYNKQHCFTETGADNLNLTVEPFATHLLRAQLGVEAEHAFDLACDTVLIVPRVQLAWVHDAFLGNRFIHARLAALGGSFCAETLYENRDRLITGLGLNALFCDCVTVFGRYDAEWGAGFLAQSVKAGFDFAF